MFQQNFQQLELPIFTLPFSGQLNPKNRWVQLRELVPWEEAERVYATNFSPTQGSPAYSAQVALGSLIIQARLKLTDRELVEQITENPYLQYFLGYEEYSDQAPFDPSLLVHFRKRFDMDAINELNEKLCSGNREMEEPEPESEDSDDDSDEKPPGPSNKGKLLVDATCTPSDISYPTDMKLLNDCREKSEIIIDLLFDEAKKSQVFTGKKPRTYRQEARKSALNFFKSKNRSKDFYRQAIKKQLSYIKRNLKHIESLKELVGLKALGAILHKKLMVIHEIYRQQKEMYDQKKHSIDDRIVSLSQPHIRPIVRGKAAAKTEFGAKISISVIDGMSFLDRHQWDAYNEVTD